MTTATITIEVDADAARAFSEASGEERRKFQLLLRACEKIGFGGGKPPACPHIFSQPLNLRLRELTTLPVRPPQVKQD